MTMPVSDQKKDITPSCYVMLLVKIQLCVVFLTSDIKLYLLHFAINSNFSQGNVGMCLSCVGKYYMNFVENLILFSVVIDFKIV